MANSQRWEMTPEEAQAYTKTLAAKRTYVALNATFWDVVTKRLIEAGFLDEGAVQLRTVVVEGKVFISAEQPCPTCGD